MNFLRVMGLVALVSLPGAVVQVYGQQEKRDEKQAKPEKQQAQPQQRQQQQQHAQQPKEQAQPQQRQQPQQHAQQPKEQAQPQQRQRQPQGQRAPQEQQRAQRQQPAAQGNPARNRTYAPPQRDRQQAQTWQQQSGWRQQGGWQEHATWQENRSSHWESDHRSWGQRGGYGGYYIPEDRFSVYFGDGHWFRIRSQPYIVGGYPRFQYGGYTFMMVDPWPYDWAQDWYSSEDVYVGYDDGYYLYNRMHPGEAIAITVVL